jgi:hypothetical protein
VVWLQRDVCPHVPNEDVDRFEVLTEGPREGTAAAPGITEIEKDVAKANPPKDEALRRHCKAEVRE